MKPSMTNPFTLSLSIIAVLLWTPTGGSEQSNTRARGSDSANLAAKVDAIFARYDKPDSPGCALGVIKDGKLVYTRGYGMANLENNIPNGPQIVYDVGSVSKQFTAASALLLAAQGKLSLDDDARKYLPELPAYQKTITIRHMLHHTSGLRDYLTLFSLAGISRADTTNEDDALRALARQKALNFTPGDEWLYSNSGYFLLSLIVKRASGKTLAAFAKEHIFDPLGMKSTIYLENHKQFVPCRATGYTAADAGGFQPEKWNCDQTGDGAVQTSVEDLLRWDQNFYEPKVGGRALLEQMQTVGALNNGHKIRYGLGLFISYVIRREPRGVFYSDGVPGYRSNLTRFQEPQRVWHGGGLPGYRSNLTRFPRQKFSVVCLCNLTSADPEGLAEQVAHLYLPDLFKAPPPPPKAGAANDPPPITLIEEELKDKVGRHYNPNTGSFRRITLRDSKLRMDPGRPDGFELVPLGPSRFRVPASGNEVAFKPRPDGKLQLKLRIARGAITEIFDPIAPPTEAELAEYAGRYFSEELDTTYHLRVENGVLQSSIKDGQGHTLQPTVPDSFFSGALQFVFQRDAQRKVSGFTLRAPRVRNLIFVRQNQ